VARFYIRHHGGGAAGLIAGAVAALRPVHISGQRAGVVVRCRVGDVEGVEGLDIFDLFASQGTARGRGKGRGRAADKFLGTLVEGGVWIPADEAEPMTRRALARYLYIAASTLENDDDAAQRFAPPEARLRPA
jgi:hypothetical protein